VFGHYFLSLLLHIKSCTNDVERRIGLASGIVTDLDKVWIAEEISRDTKVLRFNNNCVILSSLCNYWFGVFFCYFHYVCCFLRVV